MSEGLPINKPADGLDLSDRYRHDPTVEDFIHPVEIIGFSEPIPLFEPRTRQPRALLAKTLPLLGQVTSPYLGGGHGIHQWMIADYGELALVGQEGDDQTDLVLQFVSGNRIARELIPAGNRDRLLAVVRDEYPMLYSQLIGQIHYDNSETQVVSGPSGWDEIESYRRKKEEFHILSHTLAETSSGSLRIEFDTYEPTGAVKFFMPRELLCTPVIIDGKDGIEVEGVISERDIVIAGSGQISVRFRVTDEGVQIEDEVISDVLEQLGMNRGNLPAGAGELIERERVIRGIKRVWDEVLSPARNIAGSKLGSENGIFSHLMPTSPQYNLHGLGQDVMQGLVGYGYPTHKSIRFFDGANAEKTRRTPEEVAQQLFMTPKEAEQAEVDDTLTEAEFYTQFLPEYKAWSAEQVAEGAEYLREHAIDPITLLREKFEGDTRLAILGLLRHPRQDRLPLDILEQVPDVSFIAIEVRQPDDAETFRQASEYTMAKTRDGLIVETPTNFVDPDAKPLPDPARHPDGAYEDIVELAEGRGIKVLRIMKGQDWKELDSEMADQIITYMDANPQAKGIYFASAIHALYWPGSLSEEDYYETDSDRPFIDVYSIANRHYSDPNVRMAAYHLKKQLGNAVYTALQFPLPRGFGRDWRNLRTAAQAAAINQKYAIDTIHQSPFASQNNLSSPMHEIQQAIDAYDIVNLGAEGFEALLGWLYTARGWMESTEINWGNLIDGVIISPENDESVSGGEEVLQWVLEVVENH